MFKKILKSLARIFSKHDIPYIIIGGQAVLLYGEPRLTVDIDVTIGLNIDQLDKILAITSDISLKPIPKDVKAFVNRTMVLPLIDPESDIRVDIIFSFSPFEREAIQRAKVVRIDDIEVSYASLEDLIIFKVFSGRAKDHEDVSLILNKHKEMDRAYLEAKLKELSFENRDLLIEFKKLVE